MAKPTCKIDGCDGGGYARGWCSTHYNRWYHSGSPHPPAKPTVEERFWAKVDVGHPLGCWEWTATTRTGYGQMWNGQRMVDAHRMAYEFLMGPIPDGLTLDHLCRNPLCVNPDHLEPVTQAENNRRGINGRRMRQTHCKRGHEFTDENTRVHRNGSRQCLACQRQWHVDNRERLNARQRERRRKAKEHP